MERAGFDAVRFKEKYFLTKGGSKLSVHTVLRLPAYNSLTRAGRLIVKVALLSVVLAATGVIVPVAAQAVAQYYQLNIPRQPLDAALKDFAQQTGLQIARFTDKPAGNTLAGPVIGQMSVDEALRSLLGPNRLMYKMVNERTISVMTLGLASNPQGPSSDSSLSAQPAPAASTSSVPPADAAPQDSKKNFWDRLRLAQVDQGPISSDVSVGNQGQNSSTSLTEIIVTAQKREERLQDVPLSIIALTGADLQSSGALTLEDIGHQVPGLSVVAVAPGQNTLILRGISSTGGSAPTVGFYIDDTPVPTNRGDPVLFDLDRVEVLRGPQGTLYGASSEGGTVKYITSQPNLETFEGAVKGTASYTQDGGLNNEYDAMVNLPLSSTVALRASVVYRNYDGYIDRLPIDPTNILAAGTGPLDKNVNTEQTTAARLAVEFKPNDTWDMVPSVMYQRTLLGAPFTFDEPPGSFDNPIQTRDVNEPVTEQFSLISLPVHVNLGPVHLVSSTSYYDSFFQAVEDESKVGYYYFAPPQTYVYPEGFSNIFDDRVFTQELRATASVGRVEGLIGLYYTHQSDPSFYNEPIPPGFNAAFGTPFGDEQFYQQKFTDRQNDSAVFGQFGIHVTDQLEITLGDRVFRITQASTNIANGEFNGGPSPLTGVAAQEHGTTPKIGLSYHLAPDAMLYANATKGFRPGAGEPPIPVDICAADLRAIGLNAPLSSYAPDTLWEYDVGEKFTSQSLGLSVDTAFFYINWKNLQQTILLPTCGFNFTGNFGAATSKGAELEIHYNITHALRIALGGSFTQAQLTSVVNGTQGEVGSPLENVPRWMGNSSIEYRTVLRPELSGFARLDLNTTSRQYNNFDPTSIYYATAGYSLANLRFGLDTSKWQTSLFISNLLNKHAETALPASYAINLPDTRAVSLNRPRTIGFDVRRNF